MDWYPFIPYGKVTLVQGDPGDGKSTFLLTIAAMLTKGDPLPFTEPETPPEPMCGSIRPRKMMRTIPSFLASFEPMVTVRN